MPSHWKSVSFFGQVIRSGDTLSAYRTNAAAPATPETTTQSEIKFSPFDQNTTILHGGTAFKNTGSSKICL